MNARGITAIEYADESVLDDSPAAVHRKTGVMYVNPEMLQEIARMYNLNAKEKEAFFFFVFLHEWAHLVADTDDELTADALAHREYMKRGYSLKQSVFAHTRLLRFDKTEDFIRANLQLKRAQQYDHEHYR